MSGSVHLALSCFVVCYWLVLDFCISLDLLLGHFLCGLVIILWVVSDDFLLVLISGDVFFGFLRFVCLFSSHCRRLRGGV